MAHGEVFISTSLAARGEEIEDFLQLSLCTAPTFPSVLGEALRGLDLHQPSWRHEVGGATALTALAQVRAPLRVRGEDSVH